MNGHARDQIHSDLAAGRPTLSPIADQLVARLERVSTDHDMTDLYRVLEDRVGRSPAFLGWLQAPSRFLSEFDSDTTTAIEANLSELLERRTVEVRSRGWEVDPDGSTPSDIPGH